MDVAAISTSISHGKLMSQVNISLTKMGMDLAKQSEQNIKQLIESSSIDRTVTPHLGNNIDTRL